MNEEKDKTDVKIQYVLYVTKIELKLEQSGKDTKGPGPIKTLLDKAYRLIQMGLLVEAKEIIEQLLGLLF